MAPGVFQNQVGFDKAFGPLFPVSVQVIKFLPFSVEKKTNDGGRQL